MKFFRWFRRGHFPEVDRRHFERRVGGSLPPRVEGEDMEERREKRAMDRRLHRIQIELDVLRRGQ